MKILISSHAFAPSLGGLETVSQLLAGQFHRLGHEVVVVTQSESKTPDHPPYVVLRRPSLATLFRQIRWCDIFWQNNLSLRTIWPALVISKPVVVTHQGSYCRRPVGLDLVQRLKHALVNRLPTVSISQYVASCFTSRSTVIPNPYDQTVFHADDSSHERSDLIFVGRLVSEKGVDILLHAMTQLRQRGLFPRLTIAGDGPERSNLQSLTQHLSLADQVVFAGAQQPAEIATRLAHHRILVVPSRYDEPFGVVALEGIASGCLVVGSSGGGLPEAIGPCGLTVANGDVDAMADALETLLKDRARGETMRANAPHHLARFHAPTVAAAYLDFFQSVLRA